VECPQKICISRLLIFFVGSRFVVLFFFQFCDVPHSKRGISQIWLQVRKESSNIFVTCWNLLST
jgi:hypothetical protein